MVLQDETRTVELHHVAGLEHSDAMLIAYLPKEKVLFTADFKPPPAGQPVGPSIATVVQNIERLQLDFERHVMVHAPNPDRPMTKSDLLALVKETKKWRRACARGCSWGSASRCSVLRRRVTTRLRSITSRPTPLKSKARSSS